MKAVRRTRQDSLGQHRRGASHWSGVVGRPRLRSLGVRDALGSAGKTLHANTGGRTGVFDQGADALEDPAVLRLPPVDRLMFPDTPKTSLQVTSREFL